MTTAIAKLASCLALLVAAAGAGAADGHSVYILQAGDTLIGIHARMLKPGADWRELQRINRVRNVRRLVPGRPLQIPLSMLRERAEVAEQVLLAELLYTQGDVSLQRPDLSWQPLSGGASLGAGDLIRTGAQASAVLRFADGSRVLLRPGSSLRIERSVRLGSDGPFETRLRLEQGSADSQVSKQRTPNFRIVTPVANLGVRGTEFRTHAAAAQTRVEVLDGQVAAAANNTQLVGAGFGAVATPAGVATPAALPAAPDLGAVPARVERMPLRLSWSARPGEAAYRAQVFDASQADRLLLDGVFNSAAARWADDLADGRYRLRVRVVGDSGLEGLDASTEFSLKARPEPPFVTRPRANLRTAEPSLRLAWTRSTEAARYHLQVADNPDFVAPSLDRADLADNEHEVALALGTHHWRLASIRANGDVGPWGDAQAMTRVALPAAPEQQAPKATEDGVLLTWRARAGAAYQIQVARDAGFAPPLHDERIESAQWLLRQAAPGHYFVRVRSIDADGFVGPFGAVQQVVIDGPNWWPLLLLPALLLLL